MHRLRNILVPTDFSPRAEHAVMYARDLAKHYKAGIKILHVLPAPNLEFAMIEPTAESLMNAVSARQQKAMRILDAWFASELRGLDVERCVLEGDPAEQIVNFCGREPVDAIVMPTRGCGPVRRFLIGSVAAKVLHDSRCPVWTGAHIEHDIDFPEFRLRRILCAVDLGKQTEEVIAWGASLAREFAASVTVIHAGDQSPDTANLVERLRSDSVDAELIVERGEPWKVIAHAAQRLGSDLMIIGRGVSEGPLGRLKANAYAIVRHAPCPVLSV